MNNKLRFFLTSLFILFVVALRAAATGDIRVSGGKKESRQLFTRAGR
jgi:hypothetical protein